MEQSEFIWMNGEVVPWDDAQVHVLSHALHYGTSVFEGIRCDDTEIGPAVFRHQDHIDRLIASGRYYYMDLPFSKEEIREATLDLIARNGLRSCYIRPIAFRGYGSMGLFPLEVKIDLSIAVWEWGAYLGETGKRDGIRAKLSTWKRMSDESFHPKAKAGGQYLNSILAKVESHQGGYDEAIMLDHEGYVSEGSGENIYIVRDGVVITPPLGSPILEGVSRDSILAIARDLGVPVEERNIVREELIEAEEVFLSGTAAELVPVREVDDRPVGTGKPGEVTLQLQSAFEDALHGRTEKYRDWLDPVPQELYAASGPEAGVA